MRVSSGWLSASFDDDREHWRPSQRDMAERAGSTISDVAGSHLSMVSNPQATIDAILAAVAAVED
jgi:hypothetical protein